jgi:maltodextrin utilization protein YvdJ
VAKIVTFLFGGLNAVRIFAITIRTRNDMSNLSDGLMPKVCTKMTHRRDVALNGHITYVNPLNGKLATERMNVRTMKQEHKQKGMNSKSSTIVRIEAKRERIEDSMFTIAHNSRKDERREARQLERIAFREAKKRK